MSFVQSAANPRGTSLMARGRGLQLDFNFRRRPRPPHSYASFTRWGSAFSQSSLDAWLRLWRTSPELSGGGLSPLPWPEHGEGRGRPGREAGCRFLLRSVKDAKREQPELPGGWRLSGPAP